MQCWRNKDPSFMKNLEGTDTRLDGDHKEREDAIGKCYNVAKDQGFPIFALGDGGKCWACNGDAYMEYGPSEECPQSGKGLYGVANVYKIG